MKVIVQLRTQLKTFEMTEEDFNKVLKDISITRPFVVGKDFAIRTDDIVHVTTEKK